MVMVKATSQSEAGTMPSTELLAAMGNFNEELVKAGVLLAGEGLHPNAMGKRILSPSVEPDCPRVSSDMRTAAVQVPQNVRYLAVISSGAGAT
jgi:hypothetical protein